MAQDHKIFLVSDNSQSAEKMNRLLTKQHYVIRRINRRGKHDAFLLDARPHLIIIECSNIADDCYDLIKHIRQETQVPVLVVSPRDEVMDKVICLELGADDYIVIPYDESEFLARVKALLRRYVREDWISRIERTEDNLPIEKVIYPELSINLTDYSVHFQGKVVDMPPKELELFYFLASHPNQVFTREQLLDNIWSYDYIGDARTVDVHIKRIRKRFSNHPGWKLETVWGVGYKFAYREVK